MFTIFVTICSIFFTDVLFAENRNCFSQTLMDPWVMHFHILKNCPLVHNLRTINSYQLQPLFCLFCNQKCYFQCYSPRITTTFFGPFSCAGWRSSSLVMSLCFAVQMQSNCCIFFYIGLCKNNKCLFDENCFAFKLDWTSGVTGWKVILWLSWLERKCYVILWLFSFSTLTHTRLAHSLR